MDNVTWWGGAPLIGVRDLIGLVAGVLGIVATIIVWRMSERTLKEREKLEVMGKEKLEAEIVRLRASVVASSIQDKAQLLTNMRSYLVEASSMLKNRGQDSVDMARLAKLVNATFDTLRQVMGPN